MKTHASHAFSLVEVTLALGIVAFGLMALLGLLPAGLSVVREGEDERTAANLLAAVEADVRNLPAGTDTSLVYAIPVRDAGAAALSGTTYLSGAGAVVPTRQDADFALFWTINRPGDPGDPTSLWLRVAWPGRAPTPQQWVETVIAFAGESSEP